MGRVSYEKQARELAKSQNLALMTFDLVDPGSKPGKMGGRICVQGPISKENCKLAHKYLLGLIKAIR